MFRYVAPEKEISLKADGGGQPDQERRDSFIKVILQCQVFYMRQYDIYLFKIWNENAWGKSKSGEGSLLENTLNMRCNKYIATC